MLYYLYSILETPLERLFRRFLFGEIAMPSSEVYCSAAEIRAAMKAVSTDDDAMLLAIAGAVSRLIDGFMGYAEDGFVAQSTATARVYPGSGRRWMWIDICTAISSVKVKEAVTDTSFGTTLATGDYRGFRGDPTNASTVNFNKLPHHGLFLSAAASQSRWLEGSYSDSRFYFYNDRDGESDYVFEPTVEITAKWGYATTVPAPIKQAAIMQCERIYKRQQGGMADALLSPDFGQSRFLSELDKDVKVLLNMSRLKRPQLGVGR